MASYEFFRPVMDGLSVDALTSCTGLPGSLNARGEQFAGRALVENGDCPQKTDKQEMTCSDPSWVNAEKPLSRKKQAICTALPFFGPGTLIMTQNGETPVERLNASDHILTRDHGYQPILWVGRTNVPAKHFGENPFACPVVLPIGSLGANCPARPLCVSSGHHLLHRAPEAELAFLSAEVLAAASAWMHLGIAERWHPKGSLTVTHVVMATHQVIMAEGAWVESTMATTDVLCLVDISERVRVERLLDAEIDAQQAARPCLTRKEAMMLLKPAIAETPQITDPFAPLAAQ